MPMHQMMTRGLMVGGAAILTLALGCEQEPQAPATQSPATPAVTPGTPATPGTPGTPGSQSAAQTVGDVKPYPLDTCLVAGEKLGSMGAPIVLVHEGQEVKFCCADCVATFKKDPDKFLAKLKTPAEPTPPPQ